MESSKPTSLRIEDIHVDLLKPNPDNVNEMDEKTFGYLVENVREVGLIDPIQVIPLSEAGQYFIMGGEHRWRAAKQLGYNYVPCVILTDSRWSDSDYTDLISFRMNVLRGAQNPEKFFKVYDRMSAKFGQEKLQEVFAVADKALWKKLTKSLTKGMKEQGVPDAVISTIETASDKSKSFEAFNKKLVKILNEYQGQQAMGTLVLHGQKTIVITATDQLLEVIERLVTAASAKGMSVSDLICPALEGVTNGMVEGVAGGTVQQQEEVRT